MSSSPGSSAPHLAEFPRISCGAGDSLLCVRVRLFPLSALQRTRGACRPSVHQHSLTHTHAHARTYVSPEEGNLSSRWWCHFLYPDRSMHSLSTLNVSMCRGRRINSSSTTLGFSHSRRGRHKSHDTLQPSPQTQRPVRPSCILSPAPAPHTLYGMSWNSRWLPWQRCRETLPFWAASLREQDVYWIQMRLVVCSEQTLQCRFAQL